MARLVGDYSNLGKPERGLAEQVDFAFSRGWVSDEPRAGVECAEAGFFEPDEALRMAEAPEPQTGQASPITSARYFSGFLQLLLCTAGSSFMYPLLSRPASRYTKACNNLGMAVEVVYRKDPELVLHEAGAFLASDPVRHNLILTLLHARAAYPEPGRYWLARDDGAVVGVAFQSPLDFFASITPMSPEAVAGLVKAIAGARVVLPGVNGEAATAARFAGQRTERQGSAAFPVEGQRIYELAREPQVTPVGGHMRTASLDDRELVLAWMRGFSADIGEDAKGLEPVVERRLRAGHFWLWEDGGPASMAANSEPLEGVVRVQAVYTPPERRNRGYAGACVGELSRRMRGAGYRCMLYTDLGNPTSNSVYRRIGYRAVAEGLRYRFE